jgi:DNA-binding PadR family transcriptional regulator
MAPGHRAGSSTRLLILGCVRLFQPVHGYFIRRELLSWHVDDWAFVHPGSIYNALRSLTSHGLLEEVRTAAGSTRPARTSYQLTDAGESMYGVLLRDSLSDPDDAIAFLVAVNFAPSLSRDEVVTLVGEHADDLRAQVEAAPAALAAFLARQDSPPSASETLRLLAARSAGELSWCEEYLARVRSGAYAFLGEEPDWVPSEEQVAEAVVAGAGGGTRDVRAAANGAAGTGARQHGAEAGPEVDDLSGPDGSDGPDGPDGTDA